MPETMEPILIATDLDRTLIPNGEQEESPGARDRFRAFVARPEVTLVFVTGRHRGIILDAIEEWQLPQPDYVIADVGASLYQVENHKWRSLSEWQSHIGKGWPDGGCDAIATLLQDVVELTLQESEKQNVFKLSYYAPHDIDDTALIAQIRMRLVAHDVDASIVWSVDETTPIGLLDVLPRGADKLQALRFLIRKLRINERQVVFSGDSGNDLPILVSGLQSTLVANAQDNVRAVLANSSNAGNGNLYLASGGYEGMNGCYAGGILEGVDHFLGIG